MFYPVFPYKIYFMIKKKLICIHHVPGYMMIDISNSFAEKYETVYLLAGEVRKRRKDLSSNIKLIKLIKYNPSSNFSRIITWTVAFFQSLFFILKNGRDADFFFTTNPPFSIFIPLFFKNKYTLLIYDLYPDVLYEYKIFKKNSFLIRKWEEINKNVFNNAYRLITIGEGMKDKISNYVDKDKIEIISCWTDSEFLKPLSKEKNKFIEQFNLQEKFLVVYSGNLGVTHDVEVLVYLAEISTRADLFFLIIGEGDKKKFLIDLIRDKNLLNILLLPWQPVDMLPFSLSAADLAVVTLGKGASLMSVPSKMYDTMAVGSPLLIISEPDAEMVKIIELHKIGRAFTKDNTIEMLRFIDKLMDDKDYYLSLRDRSLATSKKFSSLNSSLFSDYV
jgi:glycosyltransferase involved in cell wall biosynthesis